MKILRIILVLLLLFIFNKGLAQIEIPKLTVEKIMQVPDQWIGSLPDNIFWSANSQKVYFDWNPEKNPGTTLYHFSITDLNPEKTPLKEKKELPSRRCDYTQNYDKKVYSKSGDLYLYNVKTGKQKLIFSSLDYITSAQFTNNDEDIAFVIDNNLYLYTFGKGTIKQITNIKEKNNFSGKKEDHVNKQWYINQQKELFNVFEDQNRQKRFEGKQRMILRPERPKPVYIDGDRVFNLQISPDNRFVTFVVANSGGEDQSTEFMRYVTESGYAISDKARAKVGGPQTVFDLYVIDTQKDSSYKVVADDIPGIDEWPEYFKEYGKEFSEPRKVSVFGTKWSDDNKYAVVEIRSLDNKDRWIMLLNPETGKLDLLDRQRDEAWIAGPGISGWGFYGVLEWMPDNKHIWFQSEESGYSHIYKVNVETKQKTAITGGKFEVYDPFISKDGKFWYFTSNEGDPGIRHFYKKPLNGGPRIRLTNMKGNSEVTLSPDEKWMAIRYSYTNKPWEIYLQRNKPGATPKKITSSVTEEFMSYAWRDPEVITFKARDGQDVYARIYRPEKTVKNDAAVIFVHGAGYLQNAHKWWSNYFREYMFHNLLADKGFTVLDIDYRGSAGYGRDWRTGIYRYMGGKDLSDHVDGAHWLIENEDILKDKIGIYGGSYGGFITLMALFTEPDVFAAGAALRSVTDWAHYHHSYTSNILNTPQTDSIAYRRSSPIYFAEGLEAPLLMCHGMVDDNVQFQDIVRLTQRLIELGKDDWELAVYPVEPHSFTEPSSWTDEYKRILKLFEANLVD